MISTCWSTARAAWERLKGFTEDWCGCEDYEFLARIVLAGSRLECLPAILCDYRVSSGNLAGRYGDDKLYASFRRALRPFLMETPGAFRDGVRLAVEERLARIKRAREGYWSDQGRARPDTEVGFEIDPGDSAMDPHGALGIAAAMGLLRRQTNAANGQSGASLGRLAGLRSLSTMPNHRELRESVAGMPFMTRALSHAGLSVDRALRPVVQQALNLWSRLRP